jgi:hypothetical protein
LEASAVWFFEAARNMPTDLLGVNAQNRRRCPYLAFTDAPQGQHVDRLPGLHLSFAMDQMQPAAPKAASARDRVDRALSRLEAMVDERLRAEAARSEDLAKRLSKLERQHDELKKVAMEVEGRLERAMEYIRSLLAADQK